MADYYELLGVPRTAIVGRDPPGLREAGEGAPSRPLLRPRAEGQRRRVLQGAHGGLQHALAREPARAQYDAELERPKLDGPRRDRAGRLRAGPRGAREPRLPDGGRAPAHGRLPPARRRRRTTRPWAAALGQEPALGAGGHRGAREGASGSSPRTASTTSSWRVSSTARASGCGPGRRRRRPSGSSPATRGSRSSWPQIGGRGRIPLRSGGGRAHGPAAQEAVRRAPPPCPGGVFSVYSGRDDPGSHDRAR